MTHENKTLDRDTLIAARSFFTAMAEFETLEPAQRKLIREIQNLMENYTEDNLETATEALKVIEALLKGISI